ncbi:MAG TPA: DUF58 domain-containing protein [Tepidisphaeraceae bacterium]|nr:DUF58 domain-containing protein [Tepidisphaeraceae bacterium]
MSSLLAGELQARGGTRLRLKISRQRVGALLGAAVVAAVVGTAAAHAHIAAVGLLSVLVVGLTVPAAVARWLFVRMEAVQTRVTAGESVDFHVNQPVLSLPGLCLKSPFSQDRQPLLRMSRDRPTRIRFRAPRRGVYYIGQAALLSSFPFGLLHASKMVASSSTVVVWPRPIPVNLSAVGRRPSHDAAAVWRSGDDGDAAGVRPYRRGDSMRMIHWHQSARHDRLIVRDRAAAARPTISCRLDCRTSSYSDTDEFDLAVGVAAGMVAAARAIGASMTLSIRSTFFNVVSESDARRVMDALSAVQLEAGDSVTTGAVEVLITSRRGWATINSPGGSPMLVEDFWSQVPS